MKEEYRFVLRTKKEAIYITGFMKKCKFLTEHYPTLEHLRDFREENSLGELSDRWTEEVWAWWLEECKHPHYQPHRNPNTALRWLKAELPDWVNVIVAEGDFD